MTGEIDTHSNRCEQLPVTNDFYNQTWRSSDGWSGGWVTTAIIRAEQAAAARSKLSRQEFGLIGRVLTILPLLSTPPSTNTPCTNLCGMEVHRDYNISAGLYCCEGCAEERNVSSDPL